MASLFLAYYLVVVTVAAFLETVTTKVNSMTTTSSHGKTWSQLQLSWSL